MSKIEIILGDITLLKVDAIVNAANRTLLGGGGVDGAIHRAAGPDLLVACEELNGCNTGDAKITPGFSLPSKFVIHTVGPVWRNGKYNENVLLASCYTQSLHLAFENSVRTIAFPNISTGIYGFPKAEAATIAIEAVQSFLSNHPEMKQVIFCCFDKDNFTIYNQQLRHAVEIVKVQTPEAILTVSTLASVIWNEHYVPIIGQEQVNYMISTFQSPVGIEKQISDENYAYYILYYHSEPSGYLAIKHSGEAIFLSKFYVIKEKRGYGLGKEGLRFIIARAKEFGVNKIMLTVNKNNINSIKAYEKLGFKNDGPVITEIGSGFVMDDFRMSYEL